MTVSEAKGCSQVLVLARDLDAQAEAVVAAASRRPASNQYALPRVRTGAHGTPAPEPLSTAASVEAVNGIDYLRLNSQLRTDDAYY